MRTRSMRLTTVVAIAIAVATLASVGACEGGKSRGGDRPTANAGFKDCDKSPNSCNGGTPKPGGEYTFALSQAPSNWNVHSRDGGTPATVQALSGILPQAFRTDPSGALQPNSDLLSFAELTNQTPQTVVYKIRPEAIWNDGTAITAEDFALAWKQNAGRKDLCTSCAPASTSGWRLIKSLVSSDAGKTVTVTFEDGKTYADWKGLYSTTGLYPAHLATKQGFDISKPEGVAAAAEWFSVTVPTWSGGPFLIERYYPGNALVLTRNDKWYGKIRPALDKLTLRFMPEQSALLPALRNREISGAAPAPSAALVNGAAATPGVIYRIGHGYSTDHLDLNLVNKYLADLPLRQAMFTAINVKSIVEKTYSPFDKAARQLGSHNFLPGDQYYKDVVTPTGQGTGDTTKAKKILTDAGYRIESGNLVTRSGETVPPLRLRYGKGNQAAAAMAEQIQPVLRAIGLDIRIEPIDGLHQALIAGDFDLALLTSTGGPLVQSAAEQHWLTDGGANHGKYTNATVDQLVREAAGLFDRKKVGELLNRADEILTGEAYVLPLAQSPTLVFTYQDWVNVRGNSSLWGPLYNVHEWGPRPPAK